MFPRLCIVALSFIAPLKFTFAALPVQSPASERFYAWPPSDDWPDATRGTFWTWQPQRQPSQPARLLLDLRDLNETTAGQNGWVRQSGDRIALGDGRPVRFWAVNGTGDAPIEQLEQLALDLARRGVNLVRIHGGASKTLLDLKSGRLDAVNERVIDQLHKAVVANRKAGVYTFVSNSLFIIELHVKASYAIPGYTKEWLDAHPKQDVPYGLVFLDKRLRSAFKDWLRTCVIQPNPYHPDKTPLARDTSVAAIEILNEDNLFFYTFKPENWPIEQRVQAGTQFHRWVATKYRRAEDGDDASAPVRRALALWGLRLPGDSPETGTLDLVNAAMMATDRRSPSRMGDQIAFLGDVQRGFHAEMTALLRDSGFGGLVSPSNWKTANNPILLDLEFHTYREGGLIDRHTYFSPAIAREKIKHRISAGDTYLPFSILANPTLSPANVRQMDGYPSALSEFAWVNYNPAGVEGPLVAAAYLSMSDFDMPIWFAQGKTLWTDRYGKWVTGRPSVLGQFPGAALLYRRGDVAEAPVVVREGRTLESVYRREPAALMPTSGFDSTRDDANAKSTLSASGAVDPLAMMAGKVQMHYDSDVDEVSPVLKRCIDRVGRRVTSATGELCTDWGRGLFTIDTMRAQGAIGFLRANGSVDLKTVRFEGRNRFCVLLAIALDKEPLERSQSILIQAGTVDRMKGERTKPIPMEWQGRTYAGHEIEALGKPPWEVEQIDAIVRLKGLGPRMLAATALDENGYALRSLDGKLEDSDFVVELPSEAMYTHLALRPLGTAQATPGRK